MSFVIALYGQHQFTQRKTKLENLLIGWIFSHGSHFHYMCIWSIKHFSHSIENHSFTHSSLYWQIIEFSNVQVERKRPIDDDKLILNLRYRYFVCAFCLSDRTTVANSVGNQIPLHLMVECKNIKSQFSIAINRMNKQTIGKLLHGKMSAS